MPKSGAVFKGNVIFCFGKANLFLKEGMSLPVFVNIKNVEDIYVSDELLYNSEIDIRTHKINLSMASDILNNDKLSKITVFALLNVLLSESAEFTVDASNIAVKCLESLLKQKDFTIILEQDVSKIVAEYIVR